MKSKFLLLIAVTLFLGSCTNKDAVLDTPVLDSLTASINEGNTRTTIQGTTIRWEQADVIGVFQDTDQGIKAIPYFIQLGVNQQSATFIGNSLGRKLAAIYPHEENSSYSENEQAISINVKDVHSYDQRNSNRFPMAGLVSNQNYVMFKNVCALLEIYVVGLTDEYKAISVVSGGETPQAIAGNGFIDLTNADEPVLKISNSDNAKYEVTIENLSVNGMTSESFYFPIPVNTYSNLKVYLHKQDGTKTEYLSANNFTTVRSNIHKGNIYLKEMNVWDGIAASTKFEGHGIPQSPYLIKTAGDLKLLANEVNAGNSQENYYFKMAANIDLNGKSWTPIGTEKNPFMGNLDGAGYSITGLNINTDEFKYAGLFGFAKEASFSNLNVTGNVRSTYNNSLNNGAASVFCAVAGESTFNGIKTFGTLASYATSPALVGGICGLIGGGSNTGYDACEFYNCVNSCVITTDATAGGIVGLAYVAPLITNCLNYGDISGWRAGGILGYTNDKDGKIKNCCNHSTISGNNAYAIIGDTYWSIDDENLFWIYDMNLNKGNQYATDNESSPTSDCSPYVCIESGSVLVSDYQDLVGKLNAWITNNDSENKYKKWTYKQVNGVACPTLE